MLGGVFGVGAPSISSWESGKSSPPLDRLDAYATFFATRRSVEDGLRLLRVEELTLEESRVRAELMTELTGLARGEEAAGDAPRSLWHFPDGQPVRMICGKIESEPLRRSDFRDDEQVLETPRSRYASGQELNYVGLMAYADLDSLVELFGHVRAQNPTASVQFDLAPRLESDDGQSHLVIVGGLTERGSLVSRLLRRAGVPISQHEDPESQWWGDQGEVFEITDEDRLVRPVFDDQGELAEDVGMFVRMPSPYNTATTLTVVSGVFTRGVYGAVRMLTDERVRDRNEDHLVKLFGEARTFAVLVRVPVIDHATFTPDLAAPGVLLHHWSKD